MRDFFWLIKGLLLSFAAVQQLYPQDGWLVCAAVMLPLMVSVASFIKLLEKIPESDL